ncbi:MAG: hypothetical protein M1825_000112 [Sarcosagium campestre]|nr:MAG: hypothetical protein M1825_000112 [Sarcosagium campestre]
MFPQLAPAPHHGHDTHFLQSTYPSGVTYQSLPSSPTSSDIRLSMQRQLHGFGQSQIQPVYHQPPGHYGVPLQQAGSYTHLPNQSQIISPGHNQPSSEETRLWAAEHMLRRKTPNGTLAAAYDGSPSDWPSKSRAVKHVALASNDISNGQQLLAARSNYDLPLNDLQAMAPPGFAYPATAQGNTKFDPNSHLMSGLAGADPATRWVHPLPSALGIDSMLNQVPVQQVSGYFWSDGMQTPTVMQPLYQPCLGPTASNGESPIGPYWPDGAFIPYRPAALRDPRYNTLVESQRWPGQQSHLTGGGLTQDWNVQQVGVPLTSSRGNGAQGSNPTSFMSSRTIGLANATPSGHAYQQYQNVPYGHPGHSGASSAGCFHRPVAANYRESQAQFGAQSHRQNMIPGGREQTLRKSYIRAPDTGQILGQDEPHLEAFNLSPDSVQFRDQVLLWAHGVYVDLLTSLQQSRKQGSQRAFGSGQHQHQRPGIYPKPPLQSGLNLPAQGEDISSLKNGTRALQNAAAEDRSNPFRRSSLTVDVGASASSESTQGYSDLSFSQRSLGNAPGSNRRPSLQQALQQRQLLSSAVQAGLSQQRSMPAPQSLQTLRRSSASTVSPPYPAQPDSTFVAAPKTPIANAVGALELVTKLCGDSSCQWIDGMLLAGCLAYGLGDYSKALAWYSKILGIDSNHVEALSNLAATLLSLNRREEAEQHWLRSVKLRPCYFEAVEHLIGLLCGDHRAREAIGIIDFVERSLRITNPGEIFNAPDQHSECGSPASRASSVATCESSERVTFDYEMEDPSAAGLRQFHESGASSQPGFGSSGFAIPGADNGRILALVHAKGNMLYALGDNAGAAKAFEDAVLIGAGRRARGIQALISRILAVVSNDGTSRPTTAQRQKQSQEPILLPPEKALQSAHLVFPDHGEVPGLKDVPGGMSKKAAVSTMSNSLLSLAKIFQDGMSTGGGGAPSATSGVRDILALYYLSLSLQPSPSTANNVGILLASVQQSIPAAACATSYSQLPSIPGVVPGSGIALALAYYNYGLNLDSKHAHLYTNLGSLLKDIGQLSAAIKMYEQAVACDSSFDIALANLANAVKDQGRISDAIGYYKKAVTASPDFAEAVCGLANALNSVCAWTGRGGIKSNSAGDRWHVDEQGMLLDAKTTALANSGWASRVVDIVKKQLKEGESWGTGVIQNDIVHGLLKQIEAAEVGLASPSGDKRTVMEALLKHWSGHRWEGARVVRMVERVIKRLGWRWYQDRYVTRTERSRSTYSRPQLPAALSVPSAPTVLPFHTFTCPLSAKQIRMISQRNGLRISCSTLRSPWLPSVVYPPPSPPAPCLKVGYVSSDFNNHPLAHLMQSVFGIHDPGRVQAFCYATTASDGSVHRQQIEREAPKFQDASSWSAERLVNQIVHDGIHILINLNGYTRGARNEVFASRPAPIQMSFMGFAGTIGAEWCDYLLADQIAIPPDTLRPWRRNVDVEDLARDEESRDDDDDWIYSENIIFCRDTFFCCDHRQSAPDSQDRRLSWEEEQLRRWEMRKEMFPSMSDDAIILGNFNQLYKIEPSTFRTWLRILSRVPNAVLWLLRFPDLGESNLLETARTWAGQEVASRIIFTDVAPKHQHISRARVCDLFLDTPECNAHTTAADVLWSGTPLLTLPRYKYKMCSRMAASILRGALPKTAEGHQAATELTASSEEEYEERAVNLARGLSRQADPFQPGRHVSRGRLMDLRRILFESRWKSALFDTKRWVRDLEGAYDQAWRRWVAGEGGDIWL